VQAASARGHAGPDVQRLVDTTSPGQDPDSTAAFLAAVHALLVHETPDGLAVTPHVPEDWTGQGWEVHDLPTAFGALSYAVRWHGDHPALLWDLQGTGAAAGRATAAVRITAPGLHPTWSTTEPRGEALLA
jgi:hypothetical protein